MGEVRVKALYEFASAGPGELSLGADEEVVVVRQDVGNGWWMGRNGKGEEGIFPAAYVEVMEDRRRSTVSADASHSGWGDEWDESDDESRYEDPADLQYNEPAQGLAPPKAPAKEVEKEQQSIDKKTESFTFLSRFGKSATVDNFVLGRGDVPPYTGKEVIMVSDGSDGYFRWQSQAAMYSCLVGTPKKGSKFGGLKSYITYQLTPSFSQIQVSRRYKHFDWLHERLAAKLGTVILIPPLPDKQLSGLYEADLIDKRMKQLQNFVDRICRHPVMAEAAAWKHFVSETDDKKWTFGKRKAESDPHVQSSLLMTVQAPALDFQTAERLDAKVAQLGNVVNKMDTAVKNMAMVAAGEINRQRTVCRKGCETVGAAFQLLGTAMDFGDGQPDVPHLEKIGDCYNEMALLYEDTTKKDWEPVMHLMHDFKGLVGSWSPILNFHHETLEKQKEVANDAEISAEEKSAADTRVNTLRVCVEAEMNHFRQETTGDVTYTAQTFLVEQIRFHRAMADKLEALYLGCWPGQGGGLSHGQEVFAEEVTEMRPTGGFSSGGTTTNVNAWGDQENLYEEI